MSGPTRGSHVLPASAKSTFGCAFSHSSFVTFFAFVAFSLASSAVYLVNDVVDVEKGRAHPEKRMRPIASGELPVHLAMLSAGVLAVVALVLGLAYVAWRSRDPRPADAEQGMEELARFREAMEKPPEAPLPAVVSGPVPSVDVLAEQRDFANARIGQPLCLVDDLADGPRDLRSAGIGHHAEGAELVAAFLHGHKGGDATVFDAGLTGIG